MGSGDVALRRILLAPTRGRRPTAKMEVLWSEVEGFPNYEVSNKGDVYNRKFKRYLTPRENADGYLRVRLYVDGAAHDKYVHNLVARAFFAEFRDNAHVTQVNGDKTDNRVENLRLRGRKRVEPRANMGTTWGRRVMIVETGEVFLTVGACARYIGGDFSKIYACLRGERKHHLGFTYQYYEE